MVYLYSTVKMMHGPMNIRYTLYIRVVSSYIAKNTVRVHYKDQCVNVV